MFETETIVSGPVFDGRAFALMEAGVQVIQDTVAQAGVNMIQQRLPEVLQHPTGYYASMVHTEQAAADRIITDTPVVYGPWLEGVGSRNSPVTRFAGYHTFRQVTQQLDAAATPLAAAALAPFVVAANA